MSAWLQLNILSLLLSNAADAPSKFYWTNFFSKSRILPSLRAVDNGVSCHASDCTVLWTLSEHETCLVFYNWWVVNKMVLSMFLL